MNWYIKSKIAQTKTIDAPAADIKNREEYFKELDEATFDEYKDGYSKGWIGASESILWGLGAVRGVGAGEWDRAINTAKGIVNNTLLQTPYIAPEDIKKYRRYLLASINKQIKLARKSRYPGQLEGDETRLKEDEWNERYIENEIVEGDHVHNLHSLAKAGNWTAYNDYIEMLKKEGHSQSRIDSMVSRSMLKVNLNKLPSSVS